jgi:diguanylate cyclase (GGDEF)-like protein
MKYTESHADNERSNIARLLWPSVVLLLCLVLTGIASYYASLKDTESSLAVFNLHARDASRDIVDRINIYFGVLQSAGSFFAGSNSVTRTEWERYVNFLNPQKNYPGIEGMGVIRCIPDSQKKIFENGVRREDSPDLANYTIHPPGVRKTYYPVEFYWPPLDNLNLLGLDHGAYPKGLEALERARDSGLATMSDDLQYVKNGKTDHPILFVFPIYRNGLPITSVEERQKAIWGFVYARVNVNDLFRDAISLSVSERIHLEVFEGGDQDQEAPSLDKANLIYDADLKDVPHALDASYKPRHSTIERVAVDGTSWIFYSSSRLDGAIEQRNNAPLLILLAGSLLSIGAGALTFIRNRQRQLAYQYAYYDYLTGLPNRRLLQDRFQQALANAQRHGTGLALLFIDLDKFKPINDRFGHEAGDKVLKTVAARLASCLREGDTLSRLGGDEFIVLLLNIAGEEEIFSVAQKVVAITSEPIRMKAQDLQVGCSIGISIFPKDGADFESLLKNADAAMYRAKENSRNNFQFHAC